MLWKIIPPRNRKQFQIFTAKFPSACILHFTLRPKVLTLERERERDLFQFTGRSIGLGL